jgi:hypothetical protein
MFSIIGRVCPASHTYLLRYSVFSGGSGRSKAEERDLQLIFLPLIAPPSVRRASLPRHQRSRVSISHPSGTRPRLVI